MSATDHETDQNTERAERPVLHRTFDAEFSVEGRTAYVRIVPFGEVARVADPPDFRPYDEQWMPGVFDHQLKAAHRIWANFEHQRGIAGVVGHGLELRREADGYHGAFKLHETNDGDKTLAMLRDGVLPGISLEAVPAKGGSIRTTAGVVQRNKANLMAIAFCRKGAFAGAEVLAVRHEQDIPLDQELLPHDIDSEIVDRCRRLGIQLPQRYQAHPAEADTPAETGTSEATPAETTQTSPVSEEQR